MKRYDLVIQYEDGHIHEVIGEDPGGLYVRYADYQDLEQKYKDLLMVMEEQYIKRPDPEEARKAVLVLLSAKDSVLYFESVFGVYSDEAEQARDKLTEASNALLRLMGVA